MQWLDCISTAWYDDLMVTDDCETEDKMRKRVIGVEDGLRARDECGGRRVRTQLGCARNRSARRRDPLDDRRRDDDRAHRHVPARPRDRVGFVAEDFGEKQKPSRP